MDCATTLRPAAGSSALARRLPASSIPWTESRGCFPRIRQSSAGSTSSICRRSPIPARPLGMRGPPDGITALVPDQRQRRAERCGFSPITAGPTRSERSCVKADPQVDNGPWPSWPSSG